MRTTGIVEIKSEIKQVVACTLLVNSFRETAQSSFCDRNKIFFVPVENCVREQSFDTSSVMILTECGRFFSRCGIISRIILYKCSTKIVQLSVYYERGTDPGR